MLPDLRHYEELRNRFRWEIPDEFNIAAAACDRWADDEPARPAIIHKHATGVDHISFGQLQERSNRLANLLRKLGVERGDRVAILLPQVPETAAAHIAIYKLGAVAVPLAMLFGTEALQYRLQNSGAKVLIMMQASHERIGSIRSELPSLQHVLVVGESGGNTISLHTEIAGCSERFDNETTGPDTPALMIYTSGTTGPPKGALHGHRVLLGHLPGVQFAHEFFPQDGDRMWTPSDWAWAGGLLNVLLPSLCLGVPVVAHRFEKFDASLAWELIADLAIRNVFIPPTALKMMRAVWTDELRGRVNLRTLFSGGESVGRGLQDWAGEALGLPINEVYGQTECNLVLTSCAKIGVWKPGAIGKPVPGHDVAVIDDTGNVLPAGIAGTIAVKHPDPVMFLQYWDNPQATRDKFIGDWLLTGDQGMVDEDGYFHFVGRDDDIITSSGYRIGPGEIEDCLIGHPAVKLAAAVGKPDPVRTEIVKAFVVLNDGFEACLDLEDDIRTYVRTRLSAHEYPREIAFEESLPLTTTGKVIRRLLRERP